MVAEALSEPSQSLTEACVANNVGTLDLEGGDSGAGEWKSHPRGLAESVAGMPSRGRRCGCRMGRSGMDG